MLATGTQLGPYEILTPLGAGGMGEVYRAKDARLGREVAVKVLPAAYAADAERLRRFEQEARAAGMLNHPNILAIYDIGTHDGSPYLVSELLEGETLRERLRGGALTPRKAIDHALQIARGLAAAHEKGITHRDLKPENLFVTRDGRVKILDFGLAKLMQPAPADSDETVAQSAEARTEPGVVLGTAGYMSPEQVRGQAADHRSDLFSFGAILYEMLTGERAFHGASAVETMNAILKEEPPEITAKNTNVSPALDRIVRHCLEKSPEERFRSAHDLAFDLESLSSLSGRTQAVAAAAPAPSRRRVLVLVVAAVAVLAALAVGLEIGKRLGQTPPPSFHQLTFRRGTILSARFAPDGQTIVYGAAWDGKPVEIFSTRAGSPDSRALGLTDAEILAMSPSGEMAVSQGRRNLGPFVGTGTLAQASLAGGAPRQMLEGVWQADWGPDGSSLAVVRDVGARCRLEFPIGKPLYETAGWISHARVSPKGDLVAFVDHPVFGDDGGSIAVVDASGKKRALSAGWVTAQGLAWSPGGDEVWFTATRSGSARALYAVSLSGKERLLARVAGILTLDDVARDGRVLLTHDTSRVSIFGLGPGETAERDFSWLDFSVPRDISADGKTLLFDESGEGGGAGYSIYVRKMDGSPAVRIGEGMACGLSPDGKWALALTHPSGAQQLMLLPTGPGEARLLDREDLHYQRAGWFPDGKRILILGSDPGHGPRLFVRDLAGGKSKAITPEGVVSHGPHPLSPDGRFVVAGPPDQAPVLYPVQGGEQRPIPGLALGDQPLQWGPGGSFLYVLERTQSPARVYKLDLASGRKELWKQFTVPDPAGVLGIGTVQITPDGRAYAYSCGRLLSDLYLVEGLK